MKCTHTDIASIHNWLPILLLPLLLLLLASPVLLFSHIHTHQAQCMGSKLITLILGLTKQFSFNTSACNPSCVSSSFMYATFVHCRWCSVGHMFSHHSLRPLFVVAVLCHLMFCFQCSFHLSWVCIMHEFSMLLLWHYCVGLSLCMGQRAL